MIWCGEGLAAVSGPFENTSPNLQDLQAKGRVLRKALENSTNHGICAVQYIHLELVYVSGRLTDI